MNPPPPRFPAAGWVTASANPVATAASTAFPPFFRMARPTLDAMGSTDATAPFGNDTIPAGGFASCNEAAMPNANTKNVEQKRIFLIRRNYTLASRRRGLYARVSESTADENYALYFNHSVAVIHAVRAATSRSPARSYCGRVTYR